MSEKRGSGPHAMHEEAAHHGHGQDTHAHNPDSTESGRLKGGGKVNWGDPMRFVRGGVKPTKKKIFGLATAMAVTALGAFELGTPEKTYGKIYDKAHEAFDNEGRTAKRMLEYLKITYPSIKNGTGEITKKMKEDALAELGIIKDKKFDEAQWQEVEDDLNEYYAEHKEELREIAAEKSEATPTDGGGGEAEVVPEPAVVPPDVATQSPKAAKKLEHEKAASLVATPATITPPTEAAAAPAAGGGEQKKERLVAQTESEKKVKERITSIFNEKMKKGDWKGAKTDLEALKKEIEAQTATDYLTRECLPFIKKAIAKCNEKIR